MPREDGVADRADVSALEAQARAKLDRALVKLLGQQQFDELRGRIDPVAEVYQRFGDLSPTHDQANAVMQAEAIYSEREAALARELDKNQADGMRAAAQMREAAGQHVNWREIDAAIGQMREQTEADLSKLIGSDRAWRLKQNGVLHIR